MQKKNVILADCHSEEIATFAAGCNSVVKEPFSVITSISNWGHGGFLQNIRRYAAYFAFPFKIFLKRKHYGAIMGWQQFYTINFALFCRLFHIEKCNIVIAANFTYKRKHGIIGKIYHTYMKYSCVNKYIDYFHVPSHNYVSVCNRELGIDKNKFIVTGFGVPDTYEEMKDLKVPLENYSLSIGRSNRDFDFLVKVWSQECLKDKTLVIASDTWKPASDMPSNIIFRNDIKYDESFAWFNNCDLCVTSISDGNICSGDTVLLTGMMFAKPVVVTVPSTLAEMYVEDGENGICVVKDVQQASKKIAALLRDNDRLEQLGKSARNCFLEHFSRRSMGISLCSSIKEKL